MALFEIVLPVFLVMLAGYGLRKLRVLTAQADDSLLGVMVNLFVPCLVLDVVIGNEALLRPANLILPPLAGFATVALAIGLASLTARIFFRDAVVRRTFAGVTGLQNYGYIPIPLSMVLFDREVVGVLMAFILGVEVAMWSLVRGTLAGNFFGPRWWARLLNPPILAVCGGVGLNALGAGHWMPSPVGAAMHMLGLCAIPLGLLLTGALVADYARPAMLRQGWGLTALAVTLRLGVLPVLLVASALFLPLDPALRSVLVLQAAMPTAVFPVVLAKIYGGDMPTAIRIVVATSLFGLVTIPLWLGFGLALLKG